MKKVLSISLTLALLLLVGCAPKDPAILKVFVRSATNQLVYGAKVIIIADVQSNPSEITPNYVDTSYTNSSGFTSFVLNDYFGNEDILETTGYFDILVKSNSKEASGYTRCRVHTTSVETIYLPN